MGLQRGASSRDQPWRHLAPSLPSRARRALRAACLQGSYSTPGASSCVACPAASTSGASAETCICSAGYNTTGTGATLVCQACPSNTYSLAGSPTCTACPFGSGSGVGASTCLCNPGFALSGSGVSINCTACLAGTYSPAGAPCIRTRSRWTHDGVGAAKERAWGEEGPSASKRGVWHAFSRRVLGPARPWATTLSFCCLLTPMYVPASLCACVHVRACTYIRDHQRATRARTATRQRRCASAAPPTPSARRAPRRARVSLATRPLATGPT